MKKLLLFTPIVITTIFVLTFPSWANDCPTIPEQTKEVTVKDHIATLRTEPNKLSKKGSPIFKGEKLNIVDINPTEDSEGNDYCWYKVRPVNDKNNKEYWITSIGLKEFSSWQKIAGHKSEPSNLSQVNKDDSWMSWLIWLWFLPVIPTVILSTALFKKIKNEQVEREKLFNESVIELDNLESTISKVKEEQIKIEEHFDNSINTIIENNYEIIKSNIDNLNSSSEVIESILDSVKTKKESSSEISNNENINNKTENKEDLTENFFENQDDKKECEKLVDEFNKRNKDYFAHLNLQFLKLTDQSIYDRRSRDGSLLVQLVFAQENEASYLKIEANQVNWLFPNIFSARVEKIINNLKTSIFTVDYSLNNPQLIKPAKLKEVSSGIWEIDEPGIFQSNERNTEPIKQNTKVNVEEVQVLKANKDTEIDNAHNQENQFIPSNDNVQGYDSILGDSKDINPCIISPQLQEIIDCFNQQRPELFSYFPSQPLTLTHQAIQGKVGPNACRIVQLEVPADPSQGIYLKFEIDNASWLIPNITSRYIYKIMSNLSENSDIFTIRAGSGSSLKLVMPAKLKVSTDNPGLWEIEEPGIFQSNERNTKPIKQNTKVNVEQKQPVSSGHISVVKTPEETKKTTEAKIKSIENAKPTSDFDVSNTPAEWAELVEKFNSRNTNYFENSKHRFLRLTKASVESPVGLNMRRTLQFEISPDNSSSAFLQVELDNNQWLVPNILSPSFEKSFNHLVTTDYLRKNAGIFTVLTTNSSIKPQLVRPAKLIEIMTGIWQVAEPGEFR
jgi:hypothetical protein